VRATGKLRQPSQRAQETQVQVQARAKAGSFLFFSPPPFLLLPPNSDKPSRNRRREQGSIVIERARISRKQSFFFFFFLFSPSPSVTRTQMIRLHMTFPAGRTIPEHRCPPFFFFFPPTFASSTDYGEETCCARDLFFSSLFHRSLSCAAARRSYRSSLRSVSFPPFFPSLASIGMGSVYPDERMDKVMRGSFPFFPFRSSSAGDSAGATRARLILFPPSSFSSPLFHWR